MGPFLVDTPYEACQALAANLKGFRARLLLDRSTNYRLLLDGKPMNASELHLGRSFEELHIIPVVKGEGDTPLEQVVIGAALVALSAYNLSTGGLMTPFVTQAWTALGGMGASMVLTGIASALYRPSTPNASKDKQDATSRLLSGSYQNAAGLCIPVLYGGPLRVDPVNVSLSIRNVSDSTGVTGGGDTLFGFRLFSPKRREISYDETVGSVPHGTLLFELSAVDPKDIEVTMWELVGTVPSGIALTDGNKITAATGLAEPANKRPIYFLVRAHGTGGVTADFEHVLVVYPRGSTVPSSPVIMGSGSTSTTASLPVRSKADLISSATAYWMDLISHGPIAGLYTDPEAEDQSAELRKSVYFSGTPLRTQAGEENFTDVDFKQAKGTKDQAALDVDWPILSTPHVDGRKITQSTPVTLTITNSSISEVVCAISIPQLLQTADDNGYSAGTVTLRFETFDDTEALIDAFDEVFAGTGLSAYVRDIVLRRGQRTGTWSIRISRVSPDSTEKYSSDTFLAGWTETVKAKLSFPWMAYVAGSASARNFTDMPARQYMAMGRIIQVPSNYDPLTRKYNLLNGVAQPNPVPWDGTFVDRWTDNGAWCLWDMLVNNRYGCGDWMGVNDVDPDTLLVSNRTLPNKWVFYAIGQECDRMVKSGRKDQSGLDIYEPQFAFTAHIRDQYDAYTLIQQMATSFAAISYYAAGQVWLTQDVLSDPVKIVNTTNLEKGAVHYSTGEWQSTANTIRVKWTDPQTGEDRYEVVSDRDAINVAGRVRNKDVAPMGCVSQGAARRYGRRILYTELLEGYMASVKMGIEATELFVGDIVILEDPARRSGMQYAGRTRPGCTANTIILDRRVDLAANVEWECWCELDNGVLVKRRVSNTLPYSSNTFTVDPPFPVAPFASTNVAFEKSGQAPLYRVLGIKEIARDSFDLALMSVSREKFAKINEDFLLPDPPADLRPKASGAVTGLTVGIDSMRSAKGGAPVAYASWDPKPGAASYSVEFDLGLASPSVVSVTSPNATMPLAGMPTLALGVQNTVKVRVFALVGNTISPPASASAKFLRKLSEDYLTPADRTGTPGGMGGLRGRINMSKYRSDSQVSMYINAGNPPAMNAAYTTLTTARAYLDNVLSDAPGYVYTVGGVAYPVSNWDLGFPAPPPGINPLAQYLYLGPGGMAHFRGAVESLEAAVNSFQAAWDLYSIPPS